MLRIFKHGVKLFGGEFLRSNGNAEEQNKPLYVHEHTLYVQKDVECVLIV